MSRSEPLVIVGSRLQAIAVASVAIAVVVGLVDTQPLVVIPAIAAGLFAFARLLLKVELHPDYVAIRRWRGASKSLRSETIAALGHRYLELQTPQAGTVRIEVPVEIRPNVRDWVDATPAGPEESGNGSAS